MAHVNPNQIHDLITTLEYPASKALILKNAVTKKLDSTVIALIGKLPDTDYRTSDDINTAIDSMH